MKILHFDHDPRKSQEYIVELKRMFEKQELDYTFFKGDFDCFDLNRDHLEEMLYDQDVFLAHPGISEENAEFQRDILCSYPIIYPELRIGIISLLPDDYSDTCSFGSDRIRLLDYRELEEVMAFIFEKSSM